MCMRGGPPRQIDTLTGEKTVKNCQTVKKLKCEIGKNKRVKTK